MKAANPAEIAVEAALRVKYQPRIEYKPEDYAEQAEQIARCAGSFLNFVPYWHFVNRETGRVCTFGRCAIHGDGHPGELWGGQVEFVQAASEHPWLFALKAGKLGFTELECAFDAWKLLFNHPNARVHAFSMRLDSAKDLRSYIKFGLEQLPGWMRLPLVEGPGGDTSTTLILDAGPQDRRTLVCYPSSQNVSIDQTATHTHVDELARMPFPRSTWTAIESTITDVPDASCHIVTRGAGANNFSAELWQKAIMGDSRLFPLFQPWDARPGRDERWYEREKGEHSELALSQFAPTNWQEAIAGPSSHSIIPFLWVEAALQRPSGAAGGGLVAAGCDLARKGIDMNAIAVLSDTSLVALEEWSDRAAEAPLMATVGRIVRFIEDHAIQVLALDDTGLGGGVTDRLAEKIEMGELDLLLVPVNFSTKARNAKDFHNKPSELWWTLRDNLDPEAPEPFSLHGCPPALRFRLQAQLVGAVYGFDSLGMGRIWVHKLGEADEEEGESPDLGDALCLGLEALLVYHAGEWQQGTVHLRESFLTR